MKKFTSILLSIIMFFSIGTVTVQAEPEEDTSSVPAADSYINSADNEITVEEQESFMEENDELEDNASQEDFEVDIGAEEDVESGYKAEEEDGETEGDVSEEDLLMLTSSVEDYVNTIDLGSLSLQYDDQYDLRRLSDDISPNVSYTICMKEEDKNNVQSYKVEKGSMGEKDDSLLTLKEEDDTKVLALASGVGEADVYIIQTEDLKKLETLEEENKDSEEIIDIYKVAVTVEPATLTVMFLVGQSNMEGYCDSTTGYTPSDSIACEEGKVYATYVPWDEDKGYEITGIKFSEVCTTSNYSNTAGDFVAGSLQSDTNMSGNSLEYSINSLTEGHSGKTGPDSGLAYEWNDLTKDKVWVVNTAYGATDIARWVPGGNCYERSIAIWKKVLQTYDAEIDAGHYIEGSKFIFWQQGETNDAINRTPSDYESSFSEMYSAMSSILGIDSLPFGIIIPRAGYSSENKDYKTENDLKMSAPRIAQYWLGSGDSIYSNVFVVSNANEQWVSDSGVASYFQNKYGSSLTYPTQGGAKSVPTTVDEVHSDIHYSQIGHNENGITAAYGMYNALNGSSVPSSVSWRDEDGKEISSVSFDVGGDTTTMVEVAEPIYAAKNVTYSYGNYADYDGTTGTLTGILSGDIEATYGGETIATLSVEVIMPQDISSKIGKVTGVYKYDGTWWYVIDGIIQRGYEGVEKNDNGWWYINDGKVDFAYTGFAENTNGWWYIEDGKVTFKKNDVIKDTNKKIDGTDGWWYVVESKVQLNYTDKVANFKNSNGWWYIKDGKVDFSANTVAKNNNGWYYVEGGKVQFSYNGFGSNSNGKWYCENGKVTFNKNSVIKDTTGAIGTKGTWWYVVGSKVQTSFTGLANYKNENGWWYIKNGQVDFTHNGVDKNTNGWYYITGGKVQLGFTGLANYKNENGWWYIKNGKVDFTKNTVAKNKNGWYYVNGGKVRFSFNGIAQNSNGWWYIKNGKVDFSYNGTVKASGVTYKVTNGKVAR